MNKELTCIVCPNGCDLHIAYEKAQKPLRSFPLRGRYVSGGNLCSAGAHCPKRSIASSVLVEGGELPLVSVRTKGVIPKT